MDGKQFKTLINRKAIHRPYVIYVEDYGMWSIYKTRLENAYGKLKYIHDIKNFKPTGKLLNKPNIYIYYNNKITEEFWSMTDPIIQICDKKPDARTKAVKNYKDRIITVSQPSFNSMVQFICKNSDLNDIQAAKLIELCDNYYSNDSFSFVRNELQKYRLSEMPFDEFIKIVYDRPKDSIFKLTDAICTKNKEKTLYHMEQCLAIGEAPQVVLTVLSNNCKQILQLQNCHGNIQQTGINPYIARKLQALCGFYTDEELIEVIKICNELDMNIKRGLLDSDYVIKYICGFMLAKMKVSI